MFGKKIQVPPGCVAVVNGKIDERKPLRVGTDDPIYFVSFAPCFEEVSNEAVSKEGLMHKVTVVIKLELQRNNLTEILRDAGHSTYHNIVRVSAKEFATQQNLLNSVKASIQTYTHEAGFFDLAEQDAVRQALHQRMSSECEKARLVGAVVACDVVPVVPEPSLLAQLAARAGIKETVNGEVRRREYSDSNLGQIVEYFLETLRQSELIQAETELAKADAERARVEAQTQIAIARADVKIVEQEQEHRIKINKDKLDEEDMKLQLAVHKRNATIKESNAAYEFAYERKRLEEEQALAQKEVEYKSRHLEEQMTLAQKELEIGKVKDAEEATLRERKRLDLQLELEGEAELAKIRTEEKAALLGQLGSLMEKFAEIPTPDYKGVHTLIASGGLEGRDMRHFATGLVLDLLGSAAAGLGMLNSTNKADVKEKEVPLPRPQDLAHHPAMRSGEVER